MSIRIGYVLKEFPKVSETFIARELLELETLGFEVTVLALRRPGSPAPHGWLQALRADVVECRARTSFSATWKELKHKADGEPRRKSGISTAVSKAFDCPWRSGRSYLAEAAAVASVVEERGLAHLHAHFANHPTYVSMLAHLITGIPYSFTAHAKDIYVTPLPRDAWRDQVSTAAFAVTVSDATRDHVARLVGADLDGKIRRLYNGVDLEAIKPKASSSRGPLKVLFVGRLIEKKGADVLIDAADLLRERGIAARYTIVGEGELEGDLRARVADRSLHSLVRFTGSLAHEAVVEHIRDADVLALPCRVAEDGDRDALPTVLLEALAAGVPAVSTPVNGVPEIIEHGSTGFLVPEDDPWGSAAALATLAAKPLLRQKMALAGRRCAERRFDAKKNVARLAAWFSGGSESVRPVFRAKGQAGIPATRDTRRLAR